MCFFTRYFSYTNTLAVINEKMKKKRLIKNILSISIIVVGVLIYFIYTSSIKHSLKQINLAYENHDITSIEKYIDFNSILDRIFDERMNSISDESSIYETNNYNSGRALGEKMGKEIANLMKPQLKERWKQEILSLIEVGDFENDNDNLQSFINISRVLIFNQVKSIKKEGKIALIELEYNLPRYDTIAILNVKMRNKGKYWQLFDIDNFFKNINFINQLEENRVDRMNSELKNEFFKYVKMSELKVEYSEKEDKNTYSFYFENISDKKIENLSYNFNITTKIDEDGDTFVKEYYLLFNISNFLPGQKREFEEKEYSYYPIFENQKFYIDFKSLNFKLENEKEFEWYEKWDDFELN